MAHKKAGGSAKNLRDSNPKYLGVKTGDGQSVKPGMILVRQRGSKIHPGENVKKGKDDTLFAIATGVVRFTQKKMRKFDGRLKNTKFVNIVKK
ncbi:MAG: 50S ribosomal protein L27 [Candidatus Magasanikbacteria bacterium]|jgi:large subunit ribosomal protein L27|nr:50S ribosomal protein L27 [Candidatus Magasanikbacteria bacterium]MBT5262390.1 50S ribosomal protein L27 [Candidatus Magasanikbacteria bacterium]MBT5820577.1 50S ribosomal protein L27 [Candidatus Magasanikbacteria bacterium]MBT6294513.1 50S ribosomal protein L27 [Candidatus Magasanikbacteria bacterium]